MIDFLVVFQSEIHDKTQTGFEPVIFPSKPLEGWAYGHASTPGLFIDLPYLLFLTFYSRLLIGEEQGPEPAFESTGI